MEKYFFDLEYIPSWAHKNYKDSLTTYNNITKCIVRLARAISVMENHIAAGTVPKSLNINVKAQVEKAHQSQVDQEVEEAKKVFQNTVLVSIINARKREAEDKKKARDEALKQFQEFFLTNLTELRTNNIITDSEDDLRKKYDTIISYQEETAQLIERNLRTEEHFAHKQKEEAMKKVDAARQEAQLNQVLEDSETKALKQRIDSLEKRMQQVGKPGKAGPNKPAGGATNPPKTHPKGKGPPQKRSGGPKKGPGKGNKDPKPNSTPITTRSASKKAISRKKHN